ncbi:response regulator [Fusibacter sp. 3D3]|uniref:response regulator n=1 Tax=Fusibacter sp. 3D3 TaxID=1048380 RepID=UPI002101AE3F|nr:response regulator [Fusibacter sp. 3D3]
MSRYKIRTRLYMVMAFTIISILCISIYALNTTRKVGDLVNQIKEHPLVVSNLAGDSKRLLTEILIIYQEALIEMAPSKQREYEEKIADYENELNTKMLTIQSLILGIEGQVLAKETSNNIERWHNSRADVMHHIYDFNQHETAKIDFINSLQSGQQDLQKQLNDIQVYAKNKAEGMNKQAAEIEKKAWNDIIVIGTLLVVLLLGFMIQIIKNILGSLNRLKSTMANSVEANKFLKVEWVGDDEIADVSKHYNTLIGQLETQFNMRIGLSELSNAISGELSLEMLSRESISALATFTASGNGVLYLHDDAQEALHLTAAYAFNEKQKLMKKVELGEGLIGQVALDKKAILIENRTLSEGLINTGMISIEPLNVIGMPLIFENQLYGVFELASFEAYDNSKREYLKFAAEMIAIRIYSTTQREKIHLLLDDARDINALLEVQKQEVIQKSEELTRNYEVLEAQSRTLKASEEKLQIQQEELRVTNEELEIHARQLEEQKKRLNEKNKALAMAQEELVKKADALEVTNKYKSEFLANMSHELRTPLNSILVLSQLLRDKPENTPLSEKETEFASTIYSAGEDLLTLINDVLDLSKIEAGKLNIQKEKVYLEGIIANNKKLFDPMAELKALDLRFTIDSELPEYIESDGLRLNQIIRNLVSNAIKFTSEGHVGVQIRNLKPEEADKLMILESDYIVFEVSDTGIGIPEDKMEAVFEAFRQSDGTTSREYGGTGLGLTISLEIAHLLGGYVLHESEEHIGSQFLLVMPKMPIEKKSTLEGLEKERASSETEIIGEQIEKPENKTEKRKENKTENEKRLLIIEDDPTFTQIISDLAEEKGYTVSSVQSGKRGLKRAQAWQPVAIVADIELPDMDGMALAKMLSEDKVTEHIPIHIISGAEVISGLNSFGEMPRSIVGFLKKPVDIKSIYKTLSKLESVDMKGMNQILVVGNCGDEDFEKFAQLGQFRIKKVLTGKEALVELESQTFGCLILDIKLSDISGVDFMSTLRDSSSIQIPVIIYTDEAIDLDEIDGINRYAETLILKSQRSRERLVDEVSLFLFDINKNERSRMSPQVFVGDDKKALLGVRILLADDDNRNVFALSQLLERSGVQVMVAKDGVEAVEKFEENEIDLILMDIMMPKMDGFDAMRCIRESSKGQNIPIIALTAKAMIEDRDKCIDAGANDYLIKPVDTQKLLSMIKVWLS